LYYQQNKNKENNDPDHIDMEVCSPKEMSAELKKLIYSIGQSDYIEDLEQGIAFIQTS
jgi:hypothetical protein